jgi:uncharacterized protein (DUF305 family)
MKKFIVSLLLFFAWNLSLPQHNAVAQDTRTLTPAELGKLHLQRIEEKLSVYTDADVKFMEDMIIHHSQALVMSQFAPLNGASDEVQVLAARIINAQIDEIKIMQSWLLDRGIAAPAVEYLGIESVITMIQPPKRDDKAQMSDAATDKDHTTMDHSSHTNHNAPDPKVTDQSTMNHTTMDHSSHTNHNAPDPKVTDHSTMNHTTMDHSSHTNHNAADPKVTDHSTMNHTTMDHSSHTDHSDMVGMLSLEQLAELRDARGPLFDELYLEYMIQHHEGAILMVQELFSHDGAALGVQTYKIASDIQVSQRSEITRMQHMLDERIFSSMKN